MCFRAFSSRSRRYKDVNMEIKKDDLSDGKIAALLNLHLREMLKYSPPESIHALTPEKLLNPAVTFWAARIEGELAGCGALKALSPTSGEIKSMKTNGRFLRMGVAERLLKAIIEEAKERSYTSLSLETGSHSAFAPATALYKKHGFVECEAFADYKPDPHSVFFTRTL